ncbi:MAG TPA: helix-turn-helix transcriptional regulator, partial [Burkholderiaceae bacterium]|nr:helix-turn-helix transcriptional regulator [Burkholderiaceae bacterium]
NPWMRVSERLHRPGVVRTNERLDSFLRESDALYRSGYYNDWMRPQGFRHTMGNTLLSEDDLVANITLMRPVDMNTFSASEVQSFERLSRHMTRALQMAVRLERLEATSTGPAAFDAIPLPIALVDEHRRLLHANPAMESLLRRRKGLELRKGVLIARAVAAQQELAHRVACAIDRSSADWPAPGPLWLPGSPNDCLSVQVMPVAGGQGRYLPPVRCALVMVVDASAVPAAQTPAAQALLVQHGCTNSEARLAMLICEGRALRAVAADMGITYGTARVYLKTVFEKLDVHTQAQLVARVLQPRAPDRQ